MVEYIQIIDHLRGMFQQVFVLWNLFDSLTGTIANVIEYRPSSFATGLKEASAELGHPTSNVSVGWDGMVEL